MMKFFQSCIFLCFNTIGLITPVVADDILEPDSKVTKVAGDCQFTEGPAVDPQGNLLWSDGRNDRIMKRTPDGKVSVYLQPCGVTNGMIFDAEGRLVMCQSSGEKGGRAVARQEKDGTITMLAETYHGKRFIAPNDLCIDRKGRIYFTDPYYGPPAEKSQPSSGVYRIDAPGKVTLLIDDLLKPNGILITPDNKFVYVSDRGTQKLHRYAVQPDASLKPDGIVYDFSPDRGVDGMCLDVKGNIYAAAGKDKTTGLFVVSPEGKLLLHKPMPEFSANVTFGGKDGRDLYLTATTSVYHMRTVNRGIVWPAKYSQQQAAIEKKLSGLGKLIPWTTSRVKGSPEPPPPYQLQREFPELKFTEPVYMLPEPGTDRIFVLERKGRIVSFPDRPDATESEVIFDLKSVDESLKFDMWGMTLHPRYEENGYVFLFVNVKSMEGETEPHNHIYRVQLTKQAPIKYVPDSGKLIIKWWSSGHGGGDLAFGPDGYLYITSGDGTGGSDTNNTGQDLSDLAGSILRIDVDHPDEGKAYGIPDDNPFLHIKDARPEAWTNGHRQVWRLSFDYETGNLWAGEVGQDLWEMIHLIRRGGNYGWSVYEGSHPFMLERKLGPGTLYRPIVEHPHSESRSITGGYVYRGKLRPELYGMYIYCDYETGIVWGFRYEDGKVKDHTVLTDSTYRMATFGRDHAGELYIVALSGEIYALHPSGAKETNTSDFPRKLSETGLFADVESQQPAPGVIPYSINAEAWTDGAIVQRFLGVPCETKITYGDNRGWDFEDGTVAVQTLALDIEAGNPASSRPVETRLLTRQEGQWMAYTYMWNDDGTDAELVGRDGMDRKFQIKDANAPGGMRQQTWRYAARTECMVCHSRAAKWVLGLGTAQLNCDQNYGEVTANQIRAFDHWDLFTKTSERFPEDLPQLTDPYDETADLTLRARSYLHANCSHCHVSDGGGNAKMELEFTSDDKKTDIFDVTPYHGQFSIANAKLIAQGDPFRSVILYRISKLGRGRMPQLGSSVVDERALQLFRQWIAELPANDEKKPVAENASQPSREEQFLSSIFANDEAAARTASLDSLFGSVRGAMMALGAVDDPSTPDELRGQLIDRGLAHSDARIRDLFERFLPEDKRIPRLGNSIRPEQILAVNGDADRGRNLFLNATGLQCRECHKIANHGKELGPELTHVAKEKDKVKILESLLQPSKEIHKDYVAYLVETNRGKVHSGLLVEKNESELVLKDNQHKLIRIPVTDVDLLEPQDKSLMPDLLLRDLTAQQAADLLEFLSGLK